MSSSKEQVAVPTSAQKRADKSCSGGIFLEGHPIGTTQGKPSSPPGTGKTRISPELTGERDEAGEKQQWVTWTKAAETDEEPG